MRTPITALVSLLLLLAVDASAQIVNVLPLARDRDEGLSGSLDVSVDWRTGNTELLQLGGASRLAYATGRHLLLLALQGELGLKSGDRFLAHTFEHLRYRVRVIEPLSLEAFAQHEYDQFRRLSLRAVGGAGPRVELARWDGGAFAIGSAYLFEYERLSEDSSLPDSGETRANHRWSNYLSLVVELDDAVTFNQTVYAQPRFDRFADVRVLNETALAVKIGAWVVIKTAFRLAYDDQPPAGVESLDTSLGTSLGVAF